MEIDLNRIESLTLDRLRQEHLIYHARVWWDDLGCVIVYVKFHDYPLSAFNWHLQICFHQDKFVWYDVAQTGVFEWEQHRHAPDMELVKKLNCQGQETKSSHLIKLMPNRATVHQWEEDIAQVCFSEMWSYDCPRLRK